MLVATLAIAGIFPFAGFWSKDEILAAAVKSGGINILWWLVAAATAFLTAFYMFRLYYMTFCGASRLDPHAAAHVHEAPAAMRTPLILLAVLSMLGGLLLGFPPEDGWLHRFLAPVFAPAVHLSGAHHHFAFWPDVVLMVISLALALLGWWYAYRFYVLEPYLPGEWAARWREYYTVLVNKYYVDEGYLHGVVQPIYRLSLALWNKCDVAVIDRLVHGVAGFVRLDGELLRSFQTGYVRTYALWVVIGTVLILWSLVL
jgi:NADH-quinone oxidoreductase subunit L